MEERLIEVFRKVFKNETIDRFVSKESLELWDSINHISLIVEIEAEFNVSFYPEEIYEIKSFGDIILYLQNK